MIERTPYSVGPYGTDNYPKRLGPAPSFVADGFIFVYQDVRGRYQSEGAFIEMTPHKDLKKGPKDVDESTDTYDTIDWLLKNVPNNNGKAGIYGISYPGFYAAAGMPDTHPALKACSPQAPVTDLYMGDDAYHNGAFMLEANFGFYVFFKPRAGLEFPPKDWSNFDYGTNDGYDFYLDDGADFQRQETLSQGQQFLLGRSGAASELRSILEEPRHFRAHEKRSLRGDDGRRIVRRRRSAGTLHNVSFGCRDEPEHSGPSCGRTVGAWRLGAHQGRSPGSGEFCRAIIRLILTIRCCLPFFQQYLKDAGDAEASHRAGF